MFSHSRVMVFGVLATFAAVVWNNEVKRMHAGAPLFSVASLHPELGPIASTPLPAIVPPVKRSKPAKARKIAAK